MGFFDFLKIKAQKAPADAPPNDGKVVVALRTNNGVLEAYRCYCGRFGPNHGDGAWEPVHPTVRPVKRGK